MPYPIDTAGRVPLSQLALSSPGALLSPAATVVNQFGDGGPAPPPDPPAVSGFLRSSGTGRFLRSSGGGYLLRSGS